MKQIVDRKTVGSTYSEFSFSVYPLAVLVKNFTSGDIFVSLSSEIPLQDSEAIKIPANSAQVCVISVKEDLPISFEKVLVKAVSSGEVEVQVVSW